MKYLVVTAKKRGGEIVAAKYENNRMGVVDSLYNLANVDWREKGYYCECVNEVELMMDGDALPVWRVFHGTEELYIYAERIA